MELGITPQSVKIWNHHGLIRGHAYNDKNEYLFEHPGNNPPRKAQGVKFSKRRLVDEVIVQGAHEVQYEAKSLSYGFDGRLMLGIIPCLRSRPT